MQKHATTTALAALAVAGCNDAPTASTAPMSSNLQHTLTSPFCGPITYTIQFSIDGVSIGSEMLQHGQASKVYHVSPGPHLIGARIVNWSVSRDTTATLTVGQGLNRVIDLYCSWRLCAMSCLWRGTPSSVSKNARARSASILAADVFEKAEGQNVSLVLVDGIPGIRTIGTGTQQTVESTRGDRKNCRVQVTVNGLIRYHGRVGDSDFDVTSVYAGQVIGLEYYTFPNTPAQFTGAAVSGTVVIWTK